MEKSVSFLLGAGFSAPMGYPVGNDLNLKILKCNTTEFSFHTDGTLVVTMDGKKPDFGYKTSYDLEFEFCLELFKFFNKSKVSLSSLLLISMLPPSNFNSDLIFSGSHK